MSDEPRFTKAEIITLLTPLRVSVDFHDNEDGGYVDIWHNPDGDYMRYTDVLDALSDTKSR